MPATILSFFPTVGTFVITPFVSVFFCTLFFIYDCMLVVAVFFFSLCRCTFVIWFALCRSFIHFSLLLRWYVYFPPHTITTKKTTHQVCCLILRLSFFLASVLFFHIFLWFNRFFFVLCASSDFSEISC